ncbi:putative calcium-binding protein CML22 [Acorus calamus]|uniref:Calcium-binding protein CML22 n=1 Tax=Acorus calamus TaxID=4465 RepID=A0AAV9F2R7_ACOCL|nr:putative calcium-binding protein CML22 [Acorus calamus]
MKEPLDENSNGSIEIEELMKCLGNLEVDLKGNEIADLYHYLLDDYMDLDRLQESRMLSPQLEIAFDTIIDAFLFLDKNGDGKLNKKELILALNEASPWERSPSHIAMMRFKEMDWDKNGEISLKEFLFALTKWVGMDSDDEEIPIAG